MITNNFFFTLKSIQTEQISFGTWEYFLDECLPKGFEIDENKIYFRHCDRPDLTHVYVFTIKNKVPIFLGILKEEFFYILINKNGNYRDKLIGTRLEHTNPIDIINKCFRCSIEDANQVFLKYY